MGVAPSIQKRTRGSSAGSVFASAPLIPERRLAVREKVRRKDLRPPDRNTNRMPSLVRFLSVIAIIAAVIYAGVFALAHFVQPKPREITVSIPPEKFFKDRQGP
jgi:hypothetical protein